MLPLLVFYTLSHSSDTVYKESSTVSIRFIPTNQNVKQIKFIISAYIKCMIWRVFGRSTKFSHCSSSVRLNRPKQTKIQFIL